MNYSIKVFEMFKEEMINKLEKISIDDFKDFRTWSNGHFDTIEKLLEIPEFEVEGNKSEDHKDEEKLQPKKNEDHKKDERYPIGHTFIFTKKASGGGLDKIKYPIPEDIVRNQNLQNGYKLKITGIKGSFADGNPIYHFDVVEKHIDTNTSLKEIEQGIVEKIGSRLVVRETIDGTIKDNELPVCLYINNKDLAYYKLKEGDVINGRYYSNNITNSFRVTFLYNTSQVNNNSDTTSEKRKLEYRQSTKTETTNGFSMIDRLNKKPLTNKKILLIGLSSRVNDFSSYIDKTFEVDMQHLTGDEHKQRIRAQILKSDYVLISTHENSHDTSTFVAKICNDNNIPFKSTHSTGFSGVLLDAINLIKTTDSNKQSVSS